MEPCPQPDHGAANAKYAGGRNLVGRRAPLGALIDVCPKTLRPLRGAGDQVKFGCNDGYSGKALRNLPKIIAVRVGAAVDDQTGLSWNEV